MESSIIEILRRRLSEKRQGIVEYMTAQSARDYTEYAKLCAQHQMCLEMEEDIKELEKRFMDD